MDDLRSHSVRGPIPGRLLVLERGGHASTDDGACAMEAASWLAGEPWTDHPKSVHPRVAAIARATNDALDDLRRQSLWPLILRSVGTGGRRWNWPWHRRLLLDWRLRKVIRHAGVKAGDGDALRSLWEALLCQFENDGVVDRCAEGRERTNAGDPSCFVSSPRTGAAESGDESTAEEK